MTTPFTDHAPIGTISYFSPGSQFEFETPLVDPVEMEANVPFASEEVISFAEPELEELTASELGNAVRLNTGYMKDYGWQPYVKDILKVMGVADDSWITNSAEENMKFFTNYFAGWQDRMGYKTNQKGVFGLNNWTYFQKKLGLHNLSNKHGINISNSVRENKKYSKTLWSGKLEAILQQFEDEGIVVKGLPLNDEYFAYAVADLQYKFNLDYPNAPRKLSVDGILGRNTLYALMPGLINDPGVYSSILNSKNSGELAQEFLSVWRILEGHVNQQSGDIYNAVSIKPGSSQRWGTVGTIFSVVASVLGVVFAPATGGASLALSSLVLPSLIAGAGAGAAFLGDKVDQVNNSIAKVRADMQNQTLSAYLEKIKDQDIFEASVVKLTAVFDAFIARGEKSEIVKLVENFRSLATNPEKLRRELLLLVFRNYNPKCKLIVYYDNRKMIPDWTEGDVRNVQQAAVVRVEFTKGNPYWAVANKELEPKFPDDEENILKGLWGLWSAKYSLSEFTAVTEFYIVFRTKFSAFPFDSLVNRFTPMKQDDKYLWQDLTSLNSGPGPYDIVFFNSARPQYVERFNITDTNNQGVAYKNIILSISNHAIRARFDKISSDSKINYVQKEIANESEVNELFQFNTPESLAFNNLLPSPAILKLSPRTATFLSPEVNAKATKFNITQVQKSGIALNDIVNLLATRYDPGIIEAAMADMNNQSNGTKFILTAAAGTAVDSVFTEAIHQFQIDNYLNAAEQDGVMGQSTIETLGFINHGLRPKLSGAGLYGQTQLNRSDVKPQIPTLTNNEFNSVNWFQYILKPAWLGVKITDGIHLLLLRKLREAETWLLSQPQYKGMTPAALGKALGFTASTRYSGARLSADKQAMHGFGLALDINGNGNPWIGAGWVKNDPVLLLERTRMLTALKNASGDSSLPGNNVFEYLDSIARTSGSDTTAAYNILKQRNDEFIDYLRSHSSELSYWRNSQTFANRDPLNGFLSLHHDLVYALREVAGLAWGAIDFGPRASGDIMHFDLRTIGVGKMLCEKIGGFVPTSGHPTITNEVFSDPVNHEEIEEEEFAETEMHEPFLADEFLEEFAGQDEVAKSRYGGQSTGYAANIFVKISGAGPLGEIKGAVLEKGKEGMIAAYAFSHSVISPRDSASNLPAGRKVHKPIVITKVVDISSPKLLLALVQNVPLGEVIINFWHSRRAAAGIASGTYAIFYRIKLTNASISNISQERPVTGDVNLPVLEKVEMVYQKIEWEYLGGSPSVAQDDWSVARELEFSEEIFANP